MSVFIGGIKKIRSVIPKVIRTEIVDNRDLKSFDEGKWWGIVWFDNGRDMALSFNTKRDAKWFVTKGFKEFYEDDDEYL